MENRVAKHGARRLAQRAHIQRGKHTPLFGGARCGRKGKVGEGKQRSNHAKQIKHQREESAIGKGTKCLPLVSHTGAETLQQVAKQNVPLVRPQAKARMHGIVRGGTCVEHTDGGTTSLQLVYNTRTGAFTETRTLRQQGGGRWTRACHGSWWLVVCARAGWAGGMQSRWRRVLLRRGRPFVFASWSLAIVVGKYAVVWVGMSNAVSPCNCLF